MGSTNYDQANFTQGQIDPKTQFRTDWDAYYKAAKELKNCLVLPQGCIKERWGTVFVGFADIVQNNPLYCDISTLIYDDSAIYLLVWEDSSLKIYLENILIATVVTPFAQEDIPNIRTCQVENRIIIANQNFAPRQLVRSDNAANPITNIDAPNNGLVITNPLSVGTVYPASFTTTGALPTTNPQIYTGRNYFVKPYAPTSVKIYSTASDALNDVNAYTVTALGANSNLIIRNTWSITQINFIYMPSYDFTGGYSAINFTPSAASGNITLTASAAIFTAAMVGGVFSGNGGIVRITAFTDATHVNGFTVQPFANTNAILGSLAFLGEPAWSAARGYPRVVSFFQERLVFAGTVSIPNGVWLSVINAAYDFDDSETLADNAISWYPGSGGINYVLALTSGRTLIAHGNTGNWSSPVAVDAPAVPTGFTLTEHNKFGISNIQPIYIDNQIMFVDKSGNNVINMIWEFSQQSFNTNNISVKASSLINHPVDMASFAQPNATDGFYALFCNADGTLANYQTLIEQGVGAWSLMDTYSYPIIDSNNNYTQTPSSFVRVTTGQDRCWFTIKRTLPTQQLPIAITGFTNTTLTVVAHGIPAQTAMLVTLTAVVPLTSPVITTNQYYFATRVDDNSISLYLTQADALNGENVIQIFNAGTGSTLVKWPLIDKVCIEELSFNVFQDSAKTYTFTNPTSVITGLTHLDGQVVRVKGDGYVLQDRTVVNGQITIERASTSVQVGLRFLPRFVPLPLAIPTAAGTRYVNKHIRTIYVAYYQTVGATIQFTGIPVTNMQDIIIGEPPTPRDGVYVYTPMEAWDSNDFDIIIEQPLPLPFTILALSYVVEF